MTADAPVPVPNSPTRESSPERPLGHLRVVALPGLPTLFMGKWLADLGADVIRLEPPGGDPDRCLGPLAPDSISQDSSLVWANYATGSRSVTADLTSADGQLAARRMIATADVLVEAFSPGTLDAMGLGVATLRDDNPALITVSISPFGQSGPLAHKLSSDLVNLAQSGYMHMTGNPDGSPLKPSAPYQSFLHSANHALLGLMMALRQVRRTGRGVDVDVAARDTGIWMLTHTYQHYDFAGVNLKRQGAARDMGTAVRIRSVFETLDGYVVWLFQTGPANAAALRSLIALMDEAGMAPAWLHDVAWEEVDLRTLDGEQRERFDFVFRSFFATQPKAKLFDWALAQRVMLAPVQTIADIMADPQLESRSSWTSLPTVSLPEGLRVPGAPVYMSGARWSPRGPAPEVGQHSLEVYRDELGMGDDQIQLAHSTGGI